MSNDTNNMNTDNKSISYGAKLKAAREAVGLEQKDIAAQLRLGERIIEMLESGHYASDIPVTFIRGYIRSYSRLLQLSESDIAAALEPIQQPALAPQETSITMKQSIDLTSSNYYMQFSTYAIVATLAGMLGLWWYNHTPSQNAVVAQNQTLIIPQQVAAETQSIATAPGASSQQNATTSAASNPQQAVAKQPDGAKLAAATHPHQAAPADENDDDEDNNNNTD